MCGDTVFLWLTIFLSLLLLGVFLFLFFCMNQWTNSFLFSERSVMYTGTHLKIKPFYFGQTDPPLGSNSKTMSRPCLLIMKTPAEENCVSLQELNPPQILKPAGRVLLNNNQFLLCVVQ